jgi:hypothetical protein
MSRKNIENQMEQLKPNLYTIALSTSKRTDLLEMARILFRIVLTLEVNGLSDEEIHCHATIKLLIDGMQTTIKENPYTNKSANDKCTQMVMHPDHLYLED